MRLIFIFLFVLVWYTGNSQKTTVPASPYPIIITQDDNSSITLYIRGDESNFHLVTEDRYTVVKGANGIYEYAKKDVLGRLTGSGVKARNPQDRNLSDFLYLQYTPKNIQVIPDYLERLKSATIDQAAPAATAFPTTGNNKVLMLLINFTDLPNTYPESNFTTMMNQNSPGQNVSFRDFYLANSFGVLGLTVDVFGWYTAQDGYISYGRDEGYDESQRLVREAIDAAEAAGVDFSQYDNNGDNVVDNLMVVHSGPGAEENSQTKYIWSHSYDLGGDTRFYDGVTISNYIMQPETRSWGMVGVGVFCHEFGHALGLPDLYDTDPSNGDSEGLGNWCLMASGSWNNQEATPASMSAWCKYYLNWLSPTSISAYGNYSLEPSAKNDQAYRLATPNSNEYFLLENRYNTGFDASLPGFGLAIYHVNSNKWGNDDENNKQVDLEEADGERHLDNETNRGDSGDLFPGSTSNTSFNDYTNPNSKTYTGANSNFYVKNISISGSTVNFSLAAPPVPFSDLTFESSENTLTVNGTSAQVGLVVKNDGDVAASNYRVGFYISTSSPVTSSDIFLGYKGYGGLAPGATQTISFQTDISTIPSLSLGDYFIGYIIDYQSIVVESDETNNFFTYSAPKIVHSELPNLTHVSASSLLSTTDSEVQISLEVKNTGNSTAAESKVAYYLSEDNTITTSDHLIGTDDVGVLNSNENSVESLFADVSTVLPGLPVGPYYVGFIIDYQSAVAETDENDNVFYFEQIFNYCPGVSSYFASSICEGDSVLFGGEYYKTSGQYVKTYAAQNGCDSVATFALTVHPPDEIVLNKTICQGEIYTVGSSDFSETGTFVVNLTNQYGCDSTVTLNLVVKEPQFADVYAEICSGDVFMVGNEPFATAGTYVTTISDQYGCDSTVTLYLTVHPTNDTYLTEVICEGEKIIIGNSEYGTSGVFTKKLQNQYGCDSTIHLDLTVNPVFIETINETICEGESVTFWGKTYFENGVYSQVFTNQYGCDSSYVLNLTVNPVHTTNLVHTICAGESYFVGNKAYSSSGYFITELLNSYGCDSIVGLDLLVKEPVEVTIDSSICMGESMVVGDSVYSQSGFYTNHLTDQYGCDSTLNLNLTVNPIHDTIVTYTICEGDSIVIGEAVYKSSGTFTNTLVNSFGCDSVVTLYLTVNPSQHVFLSDIICEGEIVKVGDSVYSTTGIFVQSFINQYGCDSTTTLDLIVNPVHDTTLFVEICEGDSFLMGGIWHKSSGEFTANLSNQYLCDSIVTLLLTVNPVNETVLDEYICAGDSFIVGNSVYKSSGNYTDVLSNQFGCDSVIYLNLTVNPVNNTALSITICEGESYLVGASSYSSSGEFTIVFPNQFGCDSTVNLDLFVAPLPQIDLGPDRTVLGSEGVILDAGFGFESYLWTTNEITQTITVDKLRGYGIKAFGIQVADQNNCISSDEIQITIIDDFDTPNDKDGTIKVFPNPANRIVNLVLEGLLGKYEIRIASENGAIVFSKEGYSAASKFMTTLDLWNLLPGLYTVIVISDGQVKTDKLIIMNTSN